MKKSVFDYSKLNELKGLLKKESQFVPMDPSMAAGGGGMPPPGADGMPPPEAGGMPPGGAPMDPSMMDPAMMDPSMAAGGMPPAGPPMDASGLPPPPGEEGSGDVSPDGEPYIKMTMPQLIKLVEQIAKLSTKITANAAAPVQAQQPQSAVDSAGGTDNNAAIAELNAKVDAALQAMFAMNGGGGGPIG